MFTEIEYDSNILKWKYQHSFSKQEVGDELGVCVLNLQIA